MAKAALKVAGERVETMEEPQTQLTPIQQKIHTMVKEITAALIERDEEVILGAVGMVSWEHVCLQGPPGTAKSLLGDSLLSVIDGPVYSALMMKDLPADAVLGPLDIPRLLGEKTGESEYYVLTKGYAPGAVMMFVDEIFKAGPAVLNRFLKILNERRFDNGPQTVQCPLVSCYAASNEWPSDQEGGKELAALTDRFLLRKNIKPVSTALGRQRLLWHRDHTPKITVKLNLQELKQAKAEAIALPWHQKTKDTLEKILQEIAKAGIVVGDRRQFKSVDVAAAYAYVEGATSVEPEHLEILQHVLWTDPAEQPEKAGQIIRKLANPIGTQIAERLLEAQTIVEGTNVSDVGSCIAATKKLKEVAAKLKSLKDTPKKKQAMEYVSSEIIAINKAAIASGALDD